MARISSASASSSTRASARHRALPYHCISQSFDLPPATISVSHLTCPLPPHHQSELALELELVLVLETELALVLEIELVLALEIELVLVLDIEDYSTTASVSHLTCPLPPHQSHLTCPLPPHHQSELVLVLAIEMELALDIERYHITASVNHLTCPLPPHQSVI